MKTEQIVESYLTPANVLVYLVIINAATFLMFGLDKWFAKKGMRRVSERTLFSISLIGGSPGGVLAMLFFRHKLRKASFRLTMFLIIAIQSAGLFWLIFKNSSISNQSV